MVTFGVLNPQVMSLLALRLVPGISNSVLSLFFLLPFLRVLTALMGPVADKWGKKILLVPAYVFLPLVVLIMALMPGMSGRIQARHIVWSLWGLLVVYSALQSCGLAGWFPLINDNVPPQTRGRFFGTLRTCWQTALFVISLLVGRFLGPMPDLWKFQVLLVISALGIVVRMAFFAVIPEAPLHADHKQVSLLKGLTAPMRDRSYLKFLLFSTLVSFSAGFQGPFRIRIMRDELGAGDGQVVFLTAFTFLGAVLSLYVVGRIVDRFGSRFVFAFLLPPFALLNIVWIFIDTSWPYWTWTLGLLHLAFGITFFGTGVAMTSMMMSAASPTNRGAYLNMGLMVECVAVAVAPLFSSALADALANGSVNPLGLTPTRFIFLLRVFLAALPLLVLPRLSRKHGGRVHTAVAEFPTVARAALRNFARWR